MPVLQSTTTGKNCLKALRDKLEESGCKHWWVNVLL